MPDPTNRSAAVIEIMLIECDAIFGAAAAKDVNPVSALPMAPPARKNMPPPGTKRLETKRLCRQRRERESGRESKEPQKTRGRDDSQKRHKREERECV